MDKKKRYLVTYTKGDVSKTTAVSILNVPKTRCKDGVTTMALEEVPASSDVLHFEKLGVSALELSEEEVKILQNSKEVLSVEEDYEVHALDFDQKDFLNSFLEDDGDYDFEDESFEDEYMDEDYDLDSEIEAEEYPNLRDFRLRGKKVRRPKLKKKKRPIQPWWPGARPGSIPPIAVLPRWKQRIVRAVLRDVYVSLLRNLRYSSPAPTPPSYQDYPWNMELVNAPAAWRRKITGKGVNVAVLDSGIASHVDLSISGGVSFVAGESSFNDRNGHGTHCAGILAAKNNSTGVVGVAPDVNLFAVKVLGDNCSGFTSDVIAALEWCLKNNIQVASMSLGGAYGPSLAYASIIERCQDRGLAVVVAAGNSFQTSYPWVNAPANTFVPNTPNASPIAVGAVDRRGRIANFSSRGRRSNEWNPVTCVAPGVRINSTYLKNGYTELSGTSMACPHVAGLVALLTQKYADVPANRRVALIKNIIANTSMDLGDNAFDETYGAGLINCDAAVS